MAVLTGDVTANVTLTDQLMDIIAYLAEAQKNFVNKTVDGKINEAFASYEDELGKTKDELKALVEALDSLDFKEDGQIDASVVTSKIAELEAAVKTLNDKIANLGTDTETATSDEITAIKADITTIQADIRDLKDNVIAALTDRVSALEEKYTALEERVTNLEIDVDKIKAQIDKSYI